MAPLGEWTQDHLKGILVPQASHRILVLFCGGTVLMESVQEGALGVQTKERTLNSLKHIEPMLQSIAQVDLEYVVNMDSSDMNPDTWELIAKKIHRRYEEFDGFVVIHGTDTLAYTSSALTFTLQGLSKPVVVTGAQIPATAIETDARRNLINAVRVATHPVAGVYVVFNEWVIRGARASKVSESRLNAFASVNESPAGEVGVGIRLRSGLRERGRGVPSLHLGFERRVAVLTLYPGAHVALHERLLDVGVKAVVLQAFGTGNIPENFVPFLEKAKRASIPVVLATQCGEGRTAVDAYEAGRQALRAGVIPALDMSLETAVTKLMWVLGQGTAYSDVYEKMHQDVDGEVVCLACSQDPDSYTISF